jgi:OTU domain-containing protein 6
MTGKIKRNKTKKSGSQNTPPQFIVMNPDDNRNDDDDLMNELMLQLDSRDQNVQRESAAVLNQMNLNNQPDQTGTHNKQSAKSRFQARQVNHIVAPSHFTLKLDRIG